MIIFRKLVYNLGEIDMFKFFFFKLLSVLHLLHNIVDLYISVFGPNGISFFLLYNKG